jgi:hypothetical protein
MAGNAYRAQSVGTEKQQQALRKFNERRPASAGIQRSTDRSADERTRQPVPALRARAGVTGHNVRYVLAFGLIAVVAAFLIVYLVYV